MVPPRPWPSAATVGTWCWHWALASAWCPTGSTCPLLTWSRCALRTGWSCWGQTQAPKPGSRLLSPAQKLCREAPEGVDDPPLPLTSQESMTSAQLQKLANLHSVASLSVALSVTHQPRKTSQQPVLKADFEALVARDQDLQRLRLGLVLPAARHPLSWQQRQEAFDKYLHLIYGPRLEGVHSRKASQQWSSMTLSMEKETWGASTPPTAAHSLQCAGVCKEEHTTPAAPPLKGLGSLSRHLARLSRAALPIPPGFQKVHSRASQILLKRHSKELLCNFKGFFPATAHPPDQPLRPILFPGFVPNSVVLQHLWLPKEMGALGALAQLSSGPKRPKRMSQDDQWLSGRRRRGRAWRQKLLRWLRGKPEDEEEEEEEEDKEDMDWGSTPTSLGPPGPCSEQASEPEPEAQSAAHLSWEPRGSRYADYSAEMYQSAGFPQKHHPWEERYAHLPGFLHYFVGENWFKKLFPIFTLEAYPEVATVEGLASLLMRLLEEASWADGVYILDALLMLLPNVSGDLRSRLRAILLRLLNLDQPPSLQDRTQRQFVMLALQLLLACSLESRDVVLELMSYFLYSPADCQPELRKLLRALGLQDSQGFLFKEMTTWTQGSELDSKASLRSRCGQKLEGMIQSLQMEILQPFAARLSVALSSAPESSEQALSKGSLSQDSQDSGPASHVFRTSSRASGTFSSLPWPPARVSEGPLRMISSPVLDLVARDSQAEPPLEQRRSWRARRTLSDSLRAFCAIRDASTRASAPATLQGLLLPLELADWSRSQLLDLESIDALNLFCERQLERQRNSLQEEAKAESKAEAQAERTSSHRLNTVLRRPLDHRYQPILRLQESRVQTDRMNLRGWKLPRLGVGGPLRVLKLPLPRAEPQPFPPDWPRPARPLPPLLLQPALQRYFVPDHADPDGYG